VRRSSGRSRRTVFGFAAALLALGLVAAACGSDDSSSGSGTTAGGGAGTTATGGAGTTAASTETPVAGGKLVVGIEADTGSPWTPAKILCAVSCYQTLQSVIDPLVAVNADGKPVPYLAESIEPNADYTVWTIKARSGITFHDGTPFDGAAIADNIIRQTKSFLTAKAVSDIATNPDGSPQIVVTDPMTVTITMKRSWVIFPIYLAGQLGYIGSPTWLKAADADPTLEPKPVGTGPFIFKDYKPGESFTATKNPDYWNKPYPYIDEYETRVIPDALTRAAALEAGDVDIIHTTNGDSIKKFRDDADQFPMLEETDFGETGYTLLHVTQEGSPLTDARVRCAMAYATDEQAIIDKVEAGVPKIANGPFSPAQVGNMEDSGYPVKQDMAKAQELIASYKAENPGPLNISLSTTQDATNLVIAQAQQEFFKQAGFDDVQISQIEQAKYILTALQGNFQAFQWRNHGGYDMDAQLIWWDSSNALPVGELAINFGRIKDPVIDKALADNRGATDPAVKKELAETVNKQFATECYNLWGFWTVWGIPHTPKVKDVGVFTLPNGDPASPGTGGTFAVQSVWIDPNA
jgi:peptide/nickel transport system substrate-binding protein